MENQFGGVEQPRSVPKLAESFEIDFLNARNVEIINAMSQVGGFILRSSGSESDGKVYFEGERSDGTKIRITIDKGSNYKSPAETERSGEAQFEVTDIEQLKKEYKLSLWSMTAQEADEAQASGELDKKLKDATMEAEEIIKKNGGLTFYDLERLGFFRDGDSRHYTDI